MIKLSKRHKLRKLSKRDNSDELIEKMREVVKQDQGIIDKFKEYNVPLDHIDNVHIEYADLDVSAKTKDGRIYLNSKLLDKDDPLTDSIHYVVHEMVHVLQQMTGNNDKGNADDEYIDKPTEEEAFSLQVDFKRREEGDDAAESYVDGLLDHHELSGKERTEKKKELMSE